MSRRYIKSTKRALIVAAYVAFACKAVVPIGYMPASLAEGAPFQLCDAVLSTVLNSHGHQHDHDHDKEESVQWKHCPLGALAGAEAVAVEFRLHLSGATQKRVPALVGQSHETITRVAYHSRAPPVLGSVHST
jgi:hypothetical protein